MMEPCINISFKPPHDEQKLNKAIKYVG